jgi:hypothetical protein
MFRIGILEAGFTCMLVALAVVVPLIVARGFARVNKRLKGIENEIGKRSDNQVK